MAGSHATPGPVMLGPSGGQCRYRAGAVLSRSRRRFRDDDCSDLALGSGARSTGSDLHTVGARSAAVPCDGLIWPGVSRRIPGLLQSLTIMPNPEHLRATPQVPSSSLRIHRNRMRAKQCLATLTTRQRGRTKARVLVRRNIHASEVAPSPPC